MDDYLEEIIAQRDERLDFLTCIDDGSELVDAEIWLQEIDEIDGELVTLLNEEFEDRIYQAQS